MAIEKQRKREEKRLNIKALRDRQREEAIEKERKKVITITITMITME